MCSNGSGGRGAKNSVNMVVLEVLQGRGGGWCRGSCGSVAGKSWMAWRETVAMGVAAMVAVLQD